MEMLVTAGIIRCAKLQQQTITQLFTGQVPLMSPNNSIRALKGEQYTSSKQNKYQVRRSKSFSFGTLTILAE